MLHWTRWLVAGWLLSALLGCGGGGSSPGPSAAAQFRIQEMGDPDNWLPPVQRYMYTGNGKFFQYRGYCLDPLGMAENLQGLANYPDQIWRFPANSSEDQSFALP